MSLAVMYHYVRDGSRFRCLTTRQFRDQIAFLDEHYEIVGLESHVRARRPGQCVLTFDDGLKDHILNVAPALDEFGVSGAFFVSTSTLSTRKLLAVQKRHLLFARIGTERFVEEFNALMEPHLRVRGDKALNAYDDAASSELKFLLDHMDHTQAERALGAIFSRYFDEERAFDEIYLTREDVRDLITRGHTVGTHGHAHHYLGNLYFQDQAADLAASVETLCEVTGQHPRFMSYPMGSQNGMTHRILDHLGFEAAFLDPTTHVATETRFELNRTDCIDVGPGLPVDPTKRVSQVVKW